MTTHYPLQQVGVLDGTEIPALKADGRQVNAKKRSILASKVTGTTWANGDTIVLGKKPAGWKITLIRLTTGTSLGTSTIDIGITGSLAKYADDKTLTATDTPTAIGPKASTMDDTPPDEETILATIGVADINQATVLTFEIEMVGVA
jgi:hypothetical protein